MAAEPERAPAPDEGRLPGGGRHWAGFLASGLLAFAVDAAVLEAGVRLIGLSPHLARGLAIALAMVAGWLAHRRWTFLVATRPTLSEFARYAGAAWMAALLNYALFIFVLLLWPGVPRLAALVVSSGGAMVFSYIAMRYSVFRNVG